MEYGKQRENIAGKAMFTSNFFNGSLRIVTLKKVEDLLLMRVANFRLHFDIQRYFYRNPQMFAIKY